VDDKLRRKLLAEQLELAKAAARVLEESRYRVDAVLQSAKEGSSLSIEQRESCEALTSRFARLCDLLVQRLFRTLDQVELVDDGTILDRLARAEKRGIIASAEEWRELRELRNEIAHDYLIESSDRVLTEAHRRSPQLLEAVERLRVYARNKGYVA
jgi:uncharacterized protein with von Willebrand factor type A (vWA) domain